MKSRKIIMKYVTLDTEYDSVLITTLTGGKNPVEQMIEVSI